MLFLFDLVITQDKGAQGMTGKGNENPLYSN